MDLSVYQSPVECAQACGRKATQMATGCMDKEPVYMCDECLNRGLEVIRLAVEFYQRFNKRIMVCEDCHRPIITLDTHVTLTEL